MSNEVRLWRVRENDELNEINRTTLNFEKRLQNWLIRDISVLDPNLLVIGHEVETMFGGFIDILCLDHFGDIVVVELKRDKTAREITAQVLDYASWVVDLSNDQIRSIAEAHYGDPTLEDEFRDRFGIDLPETLNSDHRMLIVGSVIDAGSERIIKYLSDSHGVNINAVTFQYFHDIDGSEFLARVFLMEPTEVEQHARTRGPSKRLPNLTYEELRSLSQNVGIDELFSYAVSRFERLLRKLTTRSSLGFTGQFGSSRHTVISLIPGESSATDGLRFHIYKRRFGALSDLALEEVEQLMPVNHTDWVYHEHAEPDDEGYQGYFASRSEIDKIAEALDGQRD